MHQHLPTRDTGTSNALTGAGPFPACNPSNQLLHQLNLPPTRLGAARTEVVAEAPDSSTQQQKPRLVWDRSRQSRRRRFVHAAEQGKEIHGAERDAMHASLRHGPGSCPNPATPALIRCLAK